MMKLLSILLGMFLLVGCDPVHSLKIENGRERATVKVIYSENFTNKNKFSQKIRIDSVTIQPSQTFEIGKVVGMYKPRPSDIKYDYLEIRYNNESIILKGKEAIFSTLQKVGSLNWRFIIK